MMTTELHPYHCAKCKKEFSESKTAELEKICATYLDEDLDRLVHTVTWRCPCGHYLGVPGYASVTPESLPDYCAKCKREFSEAEMAKLEKVNADYFDEELGKRIGYLTYRCPCGYYLGVPEFTNVTPDPVPLLDENTIDAFKEMMLKRGKWNPETKSWGGE